MPELEDIAEDLKVAEDLFGADNPGIVGGIERIVDYLNASASEYMECHGAVDADATKGVRLEETIATQNMEWVRSFKQSAPMFPEEYRSALDESKGRMRSRVYKE